MLVTQDANHLMTSWQLNTSEIELDQESGFATVKNAAAAYQRCASFLSALR